MNRFDKHKGYSRMFKENHLTLGLFFPIESSTQFKIPSGTDKKLAFSYRAI
ncbi:hypothetical protein B0I26_107129 [Anoxybacillus vitaminiphilus]|uniref:Uncharacterized protein n=1 Tax=Paranoxybacillus vitaminiphilus TaxID=581036 RepID=A0A327YDX5_9BACL|nr:hypothetical protein B0I26_107129 [Anoxybacillus vitaminiphilus]